MSLHYYPSESFFHFERHAKEISNALDVEPRYDEDEPSVGRVSIMSPPFSAASSNDSISKEKRQLEEEYPKSWTLAFLLVGLCLAVFVMSADRTIVTTVC